MSCPTCAPHNQPLENKVVVGMEYAQPQKEISNIDMRGWVPQRWSRKPKQLSGLLVTKQNNVVSHKSSY